MSMSWYATCADRYDTADWTVGVKFVQFRKNSSFNAGIKQSPYATLFGIEARIGLTSSSLPHDVIQKLQTEDDLLAILLMEVELFGRG
jgi:hypothetical protein